MTTEILCLLNCGMLSYHNHSFPVSHKTYFKLLKGFVKIRSYSFTIEVTKFVNFTLLDTRIKVF